MPLTVGSKLGAVIEVLSFDRLEPDVSLVETVTALLAASPDTESFRANPIGPTTVALDPVRVPGPGGFGPVRLEEWPR